MKTLELVNRLLTGFEAEGIPYCHWKSTTNLAASLCGDTDLDLLVSADRREQCFALLDKLNFRQASDPWEIQLPDIFHFFGFDQPSGRLVHVHLHFQLIVGDDLLKNYRLPVEEAFLASAKPVQGISVPTPEVEFITFVLRMTLKRRLLSILVRLLFLMNNPLSLLKQLFGLEIPALSRGAQSEFDDLQNKISEEELAIILCNSFPFLSPDLFQQCRQSLLGKGPRFIWMKTGKRLVRELAAYRRHTGFAAVGKMFWHAFRLRVRGVLVRFGYPCSAGKSLVSGGRLIAFVGGDGAGKTTQVNDSTQWLGRYFSVRMMHLGKPDKGLLWYAVLGTMKIRAIFSRKGKDSFHQAVQYWLVAYYRYRAFRRAIHYRRRGMIVLLDRVPLPDSRHMDSPRIAHIAGGRGGAFRLMAALEEKWHRRIKADELIVLRLDPKIAAKRRPEDDQEILAKRSGEIWSKNWPAFNVHVVDASQPLEKVVSQVRSDVWETLARRGRVVELFGPAGSGKSSLAGELRQRFYNFHAALGWRDGKLLFLTTIIKRLPCLITSLLKGVPWAHLKVAISTETVLKMLNPEYRRYYVHGTPVILEIGPAFHLAFLGKESPRFDEKWLGELRLMLRQSVDQFVWLDASDELLLSRINSRFKKHRIKDVSADEAKRFLEEYRQCFRELVGGEDDAPPVTAIDTGRLSVAECADVVARIWQQAL